MRLLRYLSVALLLGCALSSPLVAQKFDESMWGKNSKGVELVAHEGSRQHDASGTILVYNLVGTGFPANKKYDLWFWIPGKKPEKAIQHVSFDKHGVMVCSGKPGGCTGQGLDDPINIRTTAVKGEPKRFGVVSSDGQVAAFAEAVPFPIEAGDKQCKLTVVRQTPLADVVAVRATGFTPFEMLTVTGHVGGDDTVHSPTATPDGTWQAMIGNKPQGQSAGVSTIKVSGQNCSVSVSFPWGEGSDKQQ